MIELLCTDYNKKAASIHYYFGNAVLALRIVQRWALENILYKIKTSQYSYGYTKGERKGSPLVYCAEKHKNNLYVLKLDLKKFYASIKRKKVYYAFLI